MSGRSGATFARLGLDRWHFQHGPVDLVIDIDADRETGERSIRECWREFQHVLPDLVSELPALRRAADQRPLVRGAIAQRMLRGCAPFAAERFLTPMAAVAGAVADHLIRVFAQPGVRRACINNGGDIAMWLSPGASYRVGIWSRLDRPVAPSGDLGPLDSAFTLNNDSPVRGVATSGWRGRSFSLGVADSVTVLARDAATADAAATLIANAVNCEHAGIVRAPAEQLKDDSDLGARLVTVDVPPLPASAIAVALAAGRAEAQLWRERGLIHAAAIFLQGGVELVQPRALQACTAAPTAVLFEQVTA
jgi:uncharacterized protein